MTEHRPIPTIRTLEEDLIDATEQWLMTQDGLRHVYRDDWNTERALQLEQLQEVWPSAELVLDIGKLSSREYLFRVRRPLVRLTVLGRAVSVRVAADSHEEARQLAHQVRDIAPELSQHSETSVRVRFWYLTANGPRTTERLLDTPAWTTIRGNYGTPVARKLEHSMYQFRPSHGGQILLWHGEPGTGKTFALRALLWEWREWCTAEYVLDPESLFGKNVGYLLQVLLSQEEDDLAPLKVGELKQERWKLLILEDTGELVSEDAKTRSGPGLARLLNLTDGFIGQGLRVLVLITTNEEIQRLHPAVSRPGRASSIVSFADLPMEQARDWLRAHGVSPDGVNTPQRLADLYARVEQFEERSAESRRRAGFLPPRVEVELAPGLVRRI